METTSSKQNLFFPEPSQSPNPDTQQMEFDLFTEDVTNIDFVHEKVQEFDNPTALATIPLESLQIDLFIHLYYIHDPNTTNNVVWNSSLSLLQKYINQKLILTDSFDQYLQFISDYHNLFVELFTIIDQENCSFVTNLYKNVLYTYFDSHFHSPYMYLNYCNAQEAVVDHMLLDELIDNLSPVEEYTDAKSLFTSGSGKPISICAKNIENTTNLFNTSLFTSGSGKPIKLNEKKLAKAQELLSTTKEDVLMKETEAVLDTTPSLFTSGSGKAIHLKKNHLKQAQQLFSENNESNNNNNNTVPSLFTSGSGKAIHLKKNHLDQAQQLFSENNTTSSEIPSLFTSASGKPIHLKKNHLDQVQKLFSEDKINTSTEIPSLFTSGSGKQITMSKEKLEQAQKRFTDSDSSSSTATSNGDSSCLFTSGSGKKIAISKDKLVKVNNLFANLEQESSSSSTKRRLSDSHIELPSEKKQKLDITKSIRKSTSVLEKSLFKHTMVDSIIPSNTTTTPKKPTDFKPRKFVTPKKLHNSSSSTSSSITTVTTTNTTPLSKKGIEIPEWLRKKKGTKKLKQVKVNHTEQQQQQSYPIISSIDCLYMSLPFQTNCSSQFINLITTILFDTNKDSLNSKDMRQCLLHFGVLHRVATEDWVDNHFRWIVWKYYLYDYVYGIVPQQLTAENVLKNLLHRYQKEFLNGKRSCIKTIAQRDVSPSNHSMILQVASIHIWKDQLQQKDNSVIELSDGWYSINAKLDKPLEQLIQQNKIYVGQKLRMFGIKISGEQHDGCEPLELTRNSVLLLQYNSVRRGKWYQSLGFVKQSFKVNLRSLHPLGGVASMIRVQIIRRFPLLYFEKFKNRKSIWRTEYAYTHCSHVTNQNKQFVLQQEKQWEQLQKEMELEVMDECKQELIDSLVEEYGHISKIPLYHSQITDPLVLFYYYSQKNQLVFDKFTWQQKQIVTEYETKRNATMMEQIKQRIDAEWKKYTTPQVEQDDNTNGDISQVFSILVQDMCPSTTTTQCCTITLWNSNMEQYEMMREGTIIDVCKCNVRASSNNHNNNSTVELSSSHYTRFDIREDAAKWTMEQRDAFYKQTKYPIYYLKELHHITNYNNTWIDLNGIVIQKNDNSTIIMTDEDCNLFVMIQCKETSERLMQWHSQMELYKPYILSNIKLNRFDSQFNVFHCEALIDKSILVDRSVLSDRTSHLNSMNSQYAKKFKERKWELEQFASLHRNALQSIQIESQAQTTSAPCQLANFKIDTEHVLYRIHHQKNKIPILPFVCFSLAKQQGEDDDDDTNVMWECQVDVGSDSLLTIQFTIKEWKQFFYGLMSKYESRNEIPIWLQNVMTSGTILNEERDVEKQEQRFEYLQKQIFAKDIFNGENKPHLYSLLLLLLWENASSYQQQDGILNVQEKQFLLQWFEQELTKPLMKLTWTNGNNNTVAMATSIEVVSINEKVRDFV